jgi:hypothetical protein
LGRRVGQSIVWLCALSTLPVLTTVTAREYRNTHGGWWVQRQHIVQELTNEPGQHLVFVHYSPEHISGQEWVFNAADIDSAKIVWAREMSPAEDRDLVDYYPNRRVWIVYADESPPRLAPHPDYPNSNASRAMTNGRF